VFLLKLVGVRLVLGIGQVPLCPAMIVARISSIPTMVASATTLSLMPAASVFGVFVLEIKKFDDLVFKELKKIKRVSARRGTQFFLCGLYGSV